MGSVTKTRLLVSQSDEKLLGLAQHGCEVAFETLARRYRRPLLRHCRQLCLSEERAQEVLQRTFCEAWSRLQGQTQPVELQSWLRGIAQRMAAEAICPPSSVPLQRGDALGAEPIALDASLSDGAPRPEEVLALRGALAAISPLPQRSQVFMHGQNGNNLHVPVEDGFDIADSAVRGLLGRVRRGISALTPPPLLAWLAGRAAQGGAGSERIAELGAGGGAAGLTGLAVKGGIAALSAGVAITGAVIATSQHSHGSHAAHRVVAVSGAWPGVAAGAGGSGPAGAGAGDGYGAAGSRIEHRRERRTQRSGTPRSHTRLPRSGSGESSVAAAPPTTKSTTKSSPAGGGVSASSPAAAAPQASGAAQQSSTGSGQAAGGAGSQASGGGSATPPAGASGSGQPSGSGQSSGSGEASGSGGTSKGGGIGVQVSVETGSGGQTSSSGSGGSTSGGSQSGGTGVGVSISLEPIGSVGVHISLP